MTNDYPALKRWAILCRLASRDSGANHIEMRFNSDGDGTLMTMRMTLPDEKTRAAMLATGMEHGMEASYVRLEGLL